MLCNKRYCERRDKDVMNLVSYTRVMLSIRLSKRFVDPLRVLGLFLTQLSQFRKSTLGKVTDKSVYYYIIDDRRTCGEHHIHLGAKYDQSSIGKTYARILT